jgi:hypothetical protein
MRLRATSDPRALVLLLAPMEEPHHAAHDAVERPVPAGPDLQQAAILRPLDGLRGDGGVSSVLRHQGDIAEHERTDARRETVEEALYRAAARRGLEQPDVEHEGTIAKRLFVFKRERPTSLQVHDLGEHPCRACWRGWCRSRAAGTFSRRARMSWSDGDLTAMSSKWSGARSAS